MAKYDIESLLLDIETLLKNNLNNKITAINSEKNDSIVLAQIDSNAYFMQSLDGPEVNYNPFIFYGIEAISDEATGANFSFTPMRLSIAVALVMEDSGLDVNISRRMFRYQRAIKEIFEEGFDSIPEGIKLTVQSQVPIELSLLNDSYKHKAIGVTIKADMG